jgi:CBS-domain-containing membrane protein
MGHEISDEIFEEALKEIKGYVDITIDDLKKIQEIAHRHARGKPGLTPAPVKMSWKDYFSKMRGGSKSPPGVGISELLWAWFGSAIGIGIGFYLSLRYFEPRDLVLIITSFGASAVLVFGAIKSPLAQPRNLIGGTVISAFIGVASYKLFGNNIALASTIGVSCSIAAMLLTRTVHPPAGGTALIAIIGGKEIYDLGFLYPFLPAGAGVFLLLIVGLLINNLSRNRKYPEYWF